MLQKRVCLAHLNTENPTLTDVPSFDVDLSIDTETVTSAPTAAAASVWKVSATDFVDDDLLADDDLLDEEDKKKPTAEDLQSMYIY